MKLLSLLVLACLCALAQTPSPSAGIHAEFAPGVAVPEKGTVFLLETDGSSPKLQRITHSAVKLNLHVGSNYAKENLTFMIAKPKGTIDIAAAKAQLRTHDAAPAIFVYSPVREEDELSPDLAGTWNILRAIPNGDHRVVAGFSFGRFSPGASNEYKRVPAKIERVNAEWLRIVAASALEAGEYVVARVPERKDLFADAVYDFGVDK